MKWCYPIINHTEPNDKLYTIIVYFCQITSIIFQVFIIIVRHYRNQNFIEYQDEYIRKTNYTCKMLAIFAIHDLTILPRKIKDDSMFIE